MSTEELIDNKISLEQVQKAVEALHAYESKKQSKREDTQLITGKEPNIWLNVTVKQVAPKNKIKPVKIPIAYPIVDPRTTSICLITKDPQREYKDLLETQNIKFISRVVGITKLKGKFKPFEARRLLLKENGLFLADDRIIPLLPKLLGAKWFEAKKQPIPVCLTRKDLKAELERAISSTYMNQNNGTCTSIKIGTLTHKPNHIVQNITKAIPTIIQNIPGGWENIQSFFIKTNTSVSLPIWNCNLDVGEGGRWNGLSKSKSKTKGVDGDDGEEEGEGEKDKEGEKGKEGKKRSRKRKVSKVEIDNTEVQVQIDEDDKDDEEVEEQSRKKIKSSSTPTPSTTKPKSKPKPKSPKTDDIVVVKSTPEPLKEKEKKKKAPISIPTLESTSSPVPVSTPTKKSSSSSSSLTKNPIPSKIKSSPKEPKFDAEVDVEIKTEVAVKAPTAKAKVSVKGLSKEEMKQKKAITLGSTLDKKKKDKILVSNAKKSGVRSAKGKVLGKKAFQG